MSRLRDQRARSGLMLLQPWLLAIACIGLVGCASPGCSAAPTKTSIQLQYRTDRPAPAAALPLPLTFRSTLPPTRTSWRSTRTARDTTCGSQPGSSAEWRPIWSCAMQPARESHTTGTSSARRPSTVTPCAPPATPSTSWLQDRAAPVDAYASAEAGYLALPIDSTIASVSASKPWMRRACLQSATLGTRSRWTRSPAWARSPPRRT